MTVEPLLSDKKQDLLSRLFVKLYSDKGLSKIHKWLVRINQYILRWLSRHQIGISIYIKKLTEHEDMCR